MNKEDILVNIAREYYVSAEEALVKERYNVAVVLYFKAIISLVDLFLLRNIGETPSSHNSRFRMAEQFKEVYDIIDKDFPFYQNSYVQIMSKELAEVLKDDTKFMEEKTKVKL
ncbi:MAG: hypothetical protein AABW79_03595 [Nanoarchaeota archaeon]